MKKTARILLALCACMLIGGNAAMAQDRMEGSAAVKALYGAENPCSIKGAPELGEIMQKFIYSDVNNQVKMPLAQKSC